jgi:CO dehydrogenase maturation factor
MICGKGGAGKSAISILIARALAKTSTVYLIDADESNRRLGQMLGVSTPKTLMEYIGGRKQLSANREKIQDVKLGELPSEYLGRSPEGIKLVSVGKIEEFGEGCACPFGTLSKILLQRLSLKPGEFVVVDAEAGVEHLGRGVEAGIDLVISVVDPTMESVSLARFVSDEVTRIGKRHLVILNKVSSELENRLRGLVEGEGMLVSGVVGVDPVIFESSLGVGVLEAGEAQERVTQFVDRFINTA